MAPKSKKPHQNPVRWLKGAYPKVDDLRIEREGLHGARKHNYMAKLNDHGNDNTPTGHDHARHRLRVQQHEKICHDLLRDNEWSLVQIQGVASRSSRGDMSDVLEFPILVTKLSDLKVRQCAKVAVHVDKDGLFSLQNFRMLDIFDQQAPPVEKSAATSGEKGEAGARRGEEEKGDGKSQGLDKGGR